MHWTSHWQKISERIASRPDFLLASDFDGTLAPIAATPAQAVLPAETRALLRLLIARPGTHVAFISGRSLADVRMHVNIEGAYYVGNHGLEFGGPGIAMQSSHASRAHGELKRIIAELVEKTAQLEGVFIEEKGVSASVHWRLATVENCERAHAIVSQVITQYPRLRLHVGKCVWELRPRDGWNKGDAITHLMARLRVPAEDVIFLGDDITDEDAFRAATGGLTFRVGDRDVETAAHYQINDPADVQAFLLCVLGVRSKMHTGNAIEIPARHPEFASLNDLQV